jgi:hypothetical protein
MPAPQTWHAPGPLRERAQGPGRGRRPSAARRRKAAPAGFVPCPCPHWPLTQESRPAMAKAICPAPYAGSAGRMTTGRPGRRPFGAPPAALAGGAARAPRGSGTGILPWPLSGPPGRAEVSQEAPAKEGGPVKRASSGPSRAPAAPRPPACPAGQARAAGRPLPVDLPLMPAGFLPWLLRCSAFGGLNPTDPWARWPWAVSRHGPTTDAGGLVRRPGAGDGTGEGRGGPTAAIRPAGRGGD